MKFIAALTLSLSLIQGAFSQFIMDPEQEVFLQDLFESEEPRIFVGGEMLMNLKRSSALWAQKAEVLMGDKKYYD